MSGTVSNLLYIFSVQVGGIMYVGFICTRYGKLQVYKIPCLTDYDHLNWRNSFDQMTPK
jgi:hypothetical protein